MGYSIQNTHCIFRCNQAQWTSDIQLLWHWTFFHTPNNLHALPSKQGTLRTGTKPFQGQPIIQNMAKTLKNLEKPIHYTSREPSWSLRKTDISPLKNSCWKTILFRLFLWVSTSSRGELLVLGRVFGIFLGMIPVFLFLLRRPLPLKEVAPNLERSHRITWKSMS